MHKHTIITALTILCLTILSGSVCHARTLTRNHETIVVYAPGPDDDHYVNNAVLTRFKGRYWCMWQSSAKDEDSPDTHVCISSSRNGKKWSRPKTIAHCTDSTFATPGGWIVHNDTLTAFINVFKDIKAGGRAFYITTGNGRKWSSQKPVLMADGTAMNGILEQDPHRIDESRIVGAAHFRPGLKARPIYTDDLSGHGGWKIGRIRMEDKGTQSRGLEPSLYLKPDGTIVMLFRDQASSFRKLSSESRDRGRTWSELYLSDLIDSRSKQSAGNLPDGRAYIVSNPTGSKDRTRLGIAFSTDGTDFSDYIILRDRDDLSVQQKKGKYKTIGYSYPKTFIHEGYIYISYSENKEKIVITRMLIPEID